MSFEETTLREDTAARELIRTGLDESILVEAAAGTGKTTELVGRLVEILRTGRTSVDRIVAVTFTRKAAGELKLRLRQELDGARLRATSTEEAAFLESAIAHLEEAKIGTIHAFCAELLRQRPVEARLDPSFTELTEDQARARFNLVLERFVARKLHELPPGLRRWASRPVRTSYWEEASGLVDRLADAAWSLVSWRDFPAAWSRPQWDRFESSQALLAQIREIIRMESKIPRRDHIWKWVSPVVDFHAWYSEYMLDGPPDLDVLEGRLVELHGQIKKPTIGRGKLAGELPREVISTAMHRLTSSLEQFVKLSDSELASLLFDELSEVVADYQEQKRKDGCVDFLDLLLILRELLVQDATTRTHLQEKLSHLFIDEFQDTDPVQAEIILLLAADDPSCSRWEDARPVPGKLFLVGDPKQSIYRFRRADIELYGSLKTRLGQQGIRVVRLSRSFRGTQPLQALVNAAFGPVMVDDALRGQTGYVPLAGGPTAKSPASLIALPVGRAWKSDGRISFEKIEEQSPVVVANFLSWLIHRSGWTVRDPDEPDKRIPIRPKHIALLFGRFSSGPKDITRGYVRELETRSIPHLLVGSRSFHHREEVETLRAACLAIEWPEDELCVYATLRGGLFSISDEHLFLFQRNANGSIDPLGMRVRGIPELEDVNRALDILEYLHQKRNRRSVADTLSELLEITRAHAGFAMRSGGDQVLANVLRVVDSARSFEAQGGISFRGFVERLNEEASKPRSVESHAFEESAEGVRLMTVHTAKGLEFPVVVLVDLTKRPVLSEPTRHIQSAERRCAQRILGVSPTELLAARDIETRRESAEAVRLAYVAATRAKDILAIPALGTGPLEESWVGTVSRALTPPRAAWRHSEVAEGCPEFGPFSADIDSIETRDNVKPGLHRLGSYDVVWWDPKLLEESPKEPEGLENVDLLISKDHSAAADQAREAFLHFHTSRDADHAMGIEPSYVPFNPTTAREDPPGYSPRVEIVKLPIKARRPTGTRFGSLVHTVLAQVPLSASLEDIGQLCRLHGATLGSPGDEIKAALEPITQALAHPIFESARKFVARREWPFFLDVRDLHLSSGDMLEGSIDLLVEQPGAVQVIDFKTDADLEGRLDEYRRQVRWYMYALKRMRPAGTKIVGTIFRI